MTEAGRRLLEDVCERLGTRLEEADRSEKDLLDASRRLARERPAFIPDTTVDELEALRPRERMIVTLYAEGLAVDDIAQVLVISPHTVRRT